MGPSGSTASKPSIPKTKERQKSGSQSSKTDPLRTLTTPITSKTNAELLNRSCKQLAKLIQAKAFFFLCCQSYGPKIPSRSIVFGGPDTTYQDRECWPQSGLRDRESANEYYFKACLKGIFEKVCFQWFSYGKTPHKATQQQQ